MWSKFYGVILKKINRHTFDAKMNSDFFFNQNDSHFWTKSTPWFTQTPTSSGARTGSQNHNPPLDINDHFQLTRDLQQHPAILHFPQCCSATCSQIDAAVITGKFPTSQYMSDRLKWLSSLLFVKVGKILRTGIPWCHFNSEWKVRTTNKSVRSDIWKN